MDTLRSSFCAIEEFPYKALNNRKLLLQIAEGKLCPIHAVIIPTNRCNLDCDFCCCKDRIINEELDYSVLNSIVQNLSKQGTEAITISGGGEPLLYNHILETIRLINSYSIDIGLVTNGTKLNSLKTLERHSIEWCRISFGDGRNIDEVEDIFEQADLLYQREIIKLYGISYVITDEVDIQLIERVIQCVRNHAACYVKFIVDENSERAYPDYIEKIDCTKKIITPIHPCLIEEGNCYMNLIKPIFAADGYVYPCCETQYNNLDKKRCYDKGKQVKRFDEFFRTLDKQEPFIIEKCSKCFHGAMVRYLGSTKETFTHPNFI